MINFLIYYTIATMVLAAVDAVRIRFATPQKKRNIRKWISWSLGVAACGVCWELSGNPGSLATAVIATGVREAFYDPALNLMRGFQIDYESDRTNSKVDQKEQLISLSFWAQRLIGAVITAVPFIVELIKSLK